MVFGALVISTVGPCGFAYIVRKMGLVTIDLEAKLSEQVHHLQSECTYYFEGVRKVFECFLTGDGKRMSLRNRGGKCWEGCTDCKGLHSLDELPTQVHWWAFLKRHQG